MLIFRIFFVFYTKQRIPAIRFCRSNLLIHIRPAIFAMALFPAYLSRTERSPLLFPHSLSTLYTGSAFLESKHPFFDFKDDRIFNSGPLRQPTI